jgi:hypothetical protein
MTAAPSGAKYKYFLHRIFIPFAANAKYRNGPPNVHPKFFWTLLIPPKKTSLFNRKSYFRTILRERFYFWHNLRQRREAFLEQQNKNDETNTSTFLDSSFHRSGKCPN